MIRTKQRSERQDEEKSKKDQKKNEVEKKLESQKRKWRIKRKKIVEEVNKSEKVKGGWNGGEN